MKVFIDDADIRNIRTLCEYYPTDGVTTNPSILAKTGRNPKDTLTEIRQTIGPDALLFAQALAPTAEGMIEDAKRILEWCGAENTVVKIPAVREGIKAIRLLKDLGIETCGTVVYTPMQAFLAAKAGASYVAPYVNRIDNIGYDGIRLTKEIQDIMDNNGETCEVLAASFKNSLQVLELCAYGIDAVTVSPDVFEGFVRNLAIDGAVQAFAEDFRRLTGKETMAEL